MTYLLLSDFADVVIDDVASAYLSTSGVGLSFSPVLMPAVILESYRREIMSIGIEVPVAFSSECAEMDISPHPITRAWSVTDAMSVLSTFTFRLSLVIFRHQRHALKAAAESRPITFITVP